MEAARVTALRGHQVDFYEKADRLGGALCAGSVPEFKDGDRRLITGYERGLKDAGVKVHLNTEMTVNELKSFLPTRRSSQPEQNRRFHKCPTLRKL